MKQKTATYEALEQKVAHLEAQLQQQKHLDFFFQHSSDGYFFMMLDEPIHWDTNTDREATLDHIFTHQKITRFNQAILKQNRIEAAQYQGLTPGDIHKDDLAQGRRLWADLLDQGEWKSEQEIKMPETKEPLIVHCHYKAIYDEEGRFCGHFGVQRDISDEKYSRQKLVEVQDFGQAVLNSLEANICVLDKEGEIIATNESWRKFSSENDGLPERTNESANYLDVCQVIAKNSEKEWEDDKEAKQAYQGIDAVLKKDVGNFTLEYPCHSEQEERWFFMQVTALKRKEGGAVVSHLDITPLKKAHREIETNRAHLLLQELVITNLNDAILITDAEPVDEPGPVIRFCNPAFTHMTGYLPEDVLGKNPRLLQGAKTDRNVLNKIRQSLKNWEPIEVELINYKKNGEEFWVNFSLVPIANKNGCYTHWVSVQRDITSRKRQEEIEKLSELKYRTIFEEAPTAIVLFDPETLLPVEFNDKTIHMLQYSREEFAKMRLPDYVIADDVNDKVETRIEAIRKKQILKFESTIRRKDGTKCLVETVVRVIKLDGKEIFFNIWTDITTQKNFERQLKSFFDVSNDLIVIANFEGYFIQLNKAWTRVLGYSLEELKNKPWIEWIHPDDREATLKEVSKGISGEKTESLTNRYRHKNGQDVWLEWTAVNDPLEGITYASARDITLELLAKQQLTINEAKFRTLFEEAPTAIILFDPDTLLPVEFNDQTLHILQYSREEFVKMRLTEYAITDDTDQKMAERIEAIKQKQVVKFEAAVRRKDGSHCFMDVVVKAINVADRELFFNIWTDITEKKLATEKIRTGEERFRKAIDSSLDAIYILEAVRDDQQEVTDFTFVDMNLIGRQQLKFLGFEVIGRQMCEILPINREQGFFDKYKKVFLTGETLDEEFSIDLEGYEPQWLHHTVSKLGGGVVIITRDVTLKRIATESIRLSEERFRSAIDSSLDAFYILDAFYDDQGEVVDFTFVDMNTVGLRSINLPKEEIYNKNLCEVLPINREQGFFDKYKAVFITGETLDEEVLISTEALSFTWIHHTIVKLKNGIAITTRDVTPRKEYEAKLEKLNENLQSQNQALSIQEEQLSLANEELLAQQEQLRLLLQEITYNEQKFRSLAENIKDVFWIRKGNKIEYISPAYEQIWQRKVGTLYKNDQAFLEAIPKEDRQRLQRVLQTKEYRERGLLSEEYRVQRPDGTTRWVEVRTFPVEINEEEGIFHVVGIGKDITEAKAAEGRLQELNVELALKNQELIAQEEELRMTNEELKANKETLEKALELLSVSENNLQALFDSSEQAIILLDTDFKVIAFNRSVHNFHNDDFMKDFREGVNILDCFGENVHLAQAYRDKFEKCLQGDTFVFERQLNYPDFTNIRWVETTLLPVRDQLEQIIGLSFNEKDITDQRKIELKLRRSEVRLRGLMNNTIQSFFLMDKNMRLLLYNTAAENYTKDAFGKKLKIGDNFLKFAPEVLHEEFKEKFVKALAGELISNEREIIYQNGVSAWFDVTYAPIKDIEGESRMVIFSTLDITQRKQAQEREKRLLQEQIAYHLKQERLKRASILEGQERESHRISRELHDGVGQMLSALSYQINHLETTLEESKLNFVTKAYDEQIKPTSERAKQLLKEVIQEIREISHNLMPKILVDYGLIEALKQLRLDFSAGASIPINLDIFCESERFDDNIEISVFRIAQEAVNNILKYAQATEVNIQLIEHETNLQLLVEDNGIGFEIEAVKHKNTNGLINMEERTRLVHGHFSIDTELGKGTCIMVEIPLKTIDNNI
ncbi:hypothetical protein BKI52_10765 [marine bacterium AO1-C]|nr:hypothetical protein BKI52_10765 [marine bacterium AO1-C]